MKRNAKLYLEDIKDSLKKIKKYIRGLSFEGFRKDAKTQDAVIRNLEIIGEAANNIPRESKSKYPRVPWKEIVGMRNKVIHEYFGVDVEILWKTIKEDIPELERSLKKSK